MSLELSCVRCIDLEVSQGGEDSSGGLHCPCVRRVNASITTGMAQWQHRVPGPSSQKPSGVVGAMLEPFDQLGTIHAFLILHVTHRFHSFLGSAAAIEEPCKLMRFYKIIDT